MAAVNGGQSVRTRRAHPAAREAMARRTTSTRTAAHAVRGWAHSVDSHDYRTHRIHRVRPGAWQPLQPWHRHRLLPWPEQLRCGHGFHVPGEHGAVCHHYCWSTKHDSIPSTAKRTAFARHLEPQLDPLRCRASAGTQGASASHTPGNIPCSFRSCCNMPPARSHPAGWRGGHREG
jgi:hypothetical protein